MQYAIFWNWNIDWSLIPNLSIWWKFSWFNGLINSVIFLYHKIFFVQELSTLKLKAQRTETITSGDKLDGKVNVYKYYNKTYDRCATRVKRTVEIIHLNSYRCCSEQHNIVVIDVKRPNKKGSRAVAYRLWEYSAFAW